ncbi:MAG: CARDB domain-containing protein [Verrucomicrobiota bacterium]
MKKHSIPGKMNQNLRTIVKGFSISIAIILLANTRGGNLEIDASDYRYSDINTDPRYPLQNKTCELLITIHNKSDKPIEDIKLTTSIIDKQTIDTRNVRLDSNTSETVRIPWTPDDNGWYRIQARAVSEKHVVKLLQHVVFRYWRGSSIFRGTSATGKKTVFYAG